MKKLLFFIAFLYFLALLQTSFLVHFPIAGIIPNLILILVIIWNFLEKPTNYFGFLLAFLGGLFSDIFSSRPIGFNILILIGLVILIKLIFRKYVRNPLAERT